MIRSILATAGHVDHGKTALLYALTGTDCDRWKEEKRRGITIDLGFASLLRDDIQIGFVDVPGHERFIKNMLAGAGGVDGFLLVVSSEEGIKPQTLEHVEILKIFGVERGICALTKVDAVPGDLLPVVKDEVREFLQEHFKGTIPIVETSAKSGAGLDGLADALFTLVKDHPAQRDLDRPARLPLDRAFTLKGIGTVVTGSLVWGRIKKGQTLFLLPGETQVRVRSIQVHDHQREEAVARERTALNLSGVDLEEMERGQQIVGVSYPSTRRVLVEGPWLEEVKDRMRVRIHHFTGEAYGRLHLLGDPRRTQVILESPMPILRGDHVVIRRYSPPDLLGGGIVLDTILPRLRSRHPLEKILTIPVGEADAWLDLHLEMAGYQGIEESIMDYLRGYSPSAHASEPVGIPLGGRLFHRAVVKELGERLKAAVEEMVASQPLREGLPLSELASRLRVRHLPLITHVARESGFQVERGLLFPGEGGFRSSEGHERLERLLGILDDRGTFVETGELIQAVGLGEKEVRAALATLIKERRAVRIGGDLVLSRSVLDGMIEELRNQGWSEFGVGEIKSLFKLTRKYAIPFLEFLDGERVTVRKGNVRLLLPPKSAPSGY